MNNRNRKQYCVVNKQTRKQTPTNKQWNSGYLSMILNQRQLMTPASDWEPYYPKGVDTGRKTWTYRGGSGWASVRGGGSGAGRGPHFNHSLSPSHCPPPWPPKHGDPRRRPRTGNSTKGPHSTKQTPLDWGAAPDWGVAQDWGVARTIGLRRKESFGTKGAWRRN